MVTSIKQLLDTIMKYSCWGWNRETFVTSVSHAAAQQQESVQNLLILRNKVVSFNAIKHRKSAVSKKSNNKFLYFYELWIHSLLVVGKHVHTHIMLMYLACIKNLLNRTSGFCFYNYDLIIILCLLKRLVIITSVTHYYFR